MTAEPSSYRTVTVALGDRSYDIHIGDRLIAQAGNHLSPLARRPRVFVMTDETVAGLHLPTLEAALTSSGLSVSAHTLPAGEASKSMSELERALDWLLDAGADRDDLLIALGGGVVGDLAGLTAALMKRGMRLVQIPTTLLSQVDSSVGGKTAVNTRHGKNLVGAFYQPRLVLADTSILATLPPRHLRAGYAEILKYGLIDDADFFEWLESHGTDVIALKPEAISEAVARSCAAKARIVAEDERESGVRQLLNLGHTFAHALEAENGYADSLLHGEAVACGMALALRYSARQGLMTGQDVTRAARAIETAGLSAHVGALEGGPYRPPQLAARMAQDKKARAGRVPLILARGIGQSFIHPDADLADVEAFLEEETIQA
ncbi:MAG: 3-dehydroquinate synthase [Pseudomonadota bacterium]